MPVRGSRDSESEIVVDGLLVTNLEADFCALTPLADALLFSLYTFGL